MKNDRLPCVIMRGGTSKGVYILGNDLPREQAKRDQAVLAVFGSPDARQIDGLGGADPLTSKLAIIDRSERPDADIDYTFGQVDIHKAFVDYSSNCGNISAGVGPYAIAQGLVKAAEPVTRVRIYNTNTDKVFEAEVPVTNGKPQEAGDYQIDGVPGTGARIGLNMAGTVGAATGRLLPTGKAREMIEVSGFGSLEVSMVDAASPMVFVRAEAIGLCGTESPSQIDSNPQLLKLLEDIRCLAAEKMGIADQETARQKVRAIPMVAFVSPAQEYKSHTTGALIAADSVDFVSRVMFMGIMHKAYSGTATVCTGCAAVTPGTIVNELMSSGAAEDVLVRIGQPAGVIDCDMGLCGGSIKRAMLGRTARRIMEGYVYIPQELL